MIFILNLLGRKFSSPHFTSFITPNYFWRVKKLNLNWKFNLFYFLFLFLIPKNKKKKFESFAPFLTFPEENPSTSQSIHLQPSSRFAYQKVNRSFFLFIDMLLFLVRIMKKVFLYFFSFFSYVIKKVEASFYLFIRFTFPFYLTFRG